jgi:hypothetical protein
MEFCRRHCARSARDLKVLPEMLDEAEKIYQREREERGDFDVVPERFTAERLAIKTTSYMFYRYSSDQNKEENLNDVPKFVVEESNKLLDILNNRISSEKDRDTKKVIKLTNFRVAVNVISLLFASNEDPDSLRHDPYFIRCAKIITEETDGERVSFFVDGLRHCVRALLAERKERKRMAKEAVQYFDSQMSGKFNVFPYDRKRFDHLRRMVQLAEQGSRYA